MVAPPAGALAAVLAGQTKVTRRCDIYEADGVTLFSSNPRLTDGSVAVDYTRNDRRNITVTLNNSDGAIVHDPNGGLWYDKIVKVYRGVEYLNTKTQPKVRVLESAISVDIQKYFTGLGFTDVEVIAMPASINSVLTCDVLVATYGGTADIDTPTKTLIAQAYASGVNILTISPLATATTVPLISLLAAMPAQSGNSVFVVSPASIGTPFIDFEQFEIHESTGSSYTVPSAPRIGAQIGANLNFLNNAHSTAGIGIIYEVNPNGNKWVHYHMPIADTSTVGDVQAVNWHKNRDLLIKSIVGWLFSYVANLSWETQVGEFMIDNIKSPRFPKTITISGRDYWKKLANSDFDNAVTFASGLGVDSLVRDIASNAGISKFRLNSDGAVTGGSNSFDGSSSRGDAIIKICQAANVEVFFDHEGYLVTRPYFDPLTSTPTLTLKTGADGGNLVDWQETSDDSELYNRIVVSGVSQDSSITGNIYQGIAENHNPNSPTSFEKLGYFITYYYSSPFFTSNDQCLAYAKTLLAYHSLESFSMDYSSLVFAWLEAGEIVEIDRPTAEPGSPVRFLNVNFTIPLMLDAMSGTAKRITIVG